MCLRKLKISKIALLKALLFYKFFADLKILRNKNNKYKNEIQETITLAKTIKFNLILDGYPVRNLEELQNNFSIEDMLKYLKNGLLLRWLKVRGYNREYESVEKIDSGIEGKEIVKELVKIFEIEQDDASIEEGIAILDYLDEANRMNAVYSMNAFEKNRIIENYHSGYSALIQHMKEYKENMSILKADARQLEREYIGLFKLDHEKLYFWLFENAPKAIFAILTIDAFRTFWIGEQKNERVAKHIRNTLMISVKRILGDNLKIVKKNTQSMWDQIESEGVVVMLISIASGAFVKSAGGSGDELAYTDVNEKFLKLNGLQYQCNNKAYELLYMEVCHEKKC